MACYGNARNANGAFQNGRRRNSRRGAVSGLNAAAAANAQEPAPAVELYEPEPQAEEALHTCCDMYTGCHQFRSSLRSSFWPAFAHPRWMSCRDLYSGGKAD